MDRRTFLHYGALSGAVAITDPAPPRPASEPGTPGPLHPPYRPPAPAPLDEKTIAELREGMRTGEYTARALAEQYLARVEEVDRRGPAVRAVIEVNPDALAIADALDAERKAGRVRGPLHGIPVMLKDNIDTADRMMTTAGSLALAGNIAARDAFVAERLRAAGAVILGKTNLSEWANFRSTHSTSGWSARGGQTRNPYALDRNPCGSSSGSGAAVAASLCAAAVGTETDGSIVCPSSANGIVGVKPTVGLVSRAGIIPISHSQDTAGPMARTVADAAALLGALVGADARDPVTAASRGRARADYTAELDVGALRGARLGIARNYFGFSAAVDAVMETAIAAMKEAGAVIVDRANIPTAGKVDAPEFEVLLYEFKADLNAYLGALPPSALVHSLKDVIDFNERNRDREMPYFGQEIMIQAQAKGPLTSAAYRTVRASCLRLARTQGIDAVMIAHRLDAIVAPTGGPAWPTDLLNGDHFSGGSSTHAAVAGYPNVNVPAGSIHGLPVGVSFFGRAWSEPTLLRLAYAFEQATKHRAPPRFLPTAEL
ncbi:MAG: amidase [Gemmatimonadaceae bacterium]